MKSRSIIILFSIIVVAIGLSVLSYLGIGTEHTLGVKNIKQGLDLKGGVSITYEADKVAVTTEEMQSAQSLLQERLDRKNYTEAEVAVQGTNRLRIDIPDVDDPEQIIKEIGKTAQLFFVDEAGKVLLTGERVTNAYKTVSSGSNNGPSSVVVGLEFDTEGQKLFEEATGNNVGKRIIIMLDDEVLSSPMVEQKISGGNAVITGNFTTEEAEELGALIRSGSLPFKLDIISTSNVGAKLGANSLQTSVIAGIIGFAFVFVFMLFVYRIAGLAADIALILFTGLLLVLVSAFGITLTLPGVAGIILTVAMAIDGNIIIFERLKEELESGRTTRASVAAGFKRAVPAIVDGHMTALIAGVVLFWLGTGPIKGFAQTLSVGIVLSLFTSIVVTRFILQGFVALGADKPELFGAKKRETITHKTYDFIKHRNKYFIFSLVIIFVGLSVMIYNTAIGKGAFNYDVEFSGGTSLEIDLGRDFSNSDVIAIVAEVTGQNSPQVQKVSGTTQVLIKIRSIDQDTRIKLIDKFKEKYSIQAEHFTYDDVSPTVSSEMRSTAVLAVLVASVVMLIYISIRFKDFKRGSSAISALLHDTLLMLVAYAVLRIPLNYSFIAAILTILGYSVNATIVIFDRIRENEKRLSHPAIDDLINISVSQTLRRSIFTTISTLVPVIALYIIGVPSIKEFTMPLIVGLVGGAYSSVCMSGSIWYLLCNKFGKK